MVLAIVVHSALVGGYLLRPSSKGKRKTSSDGKSPVASK